MPQSINVFSMSLSISIASKVLMLRTCRLAHLSLCVSVWKMYYGETTERIRMPFGVCPGSPWFLRYAVHVHDNGGTWF